MKEALQGNSGQERIPVFTSPLEDLAKKFPYVRGHDELMRYIQFLGVFVPDVNSLIQDPSYLNALLPELVQDVPNHRYPVAFGVAEQTITTLPEQYRAALNTITLSECYFGVKRVNSGNITLCESAEPNLRFAMENNGCTVINDVLLMKHAGIKSALCLKSFSTTAGTFIEGNWYTGISQEFREFLGSQFIAGKGRLTLSEGMWMLSREIDQDYTLLPFARSVAAQIPEKLPGTLEQRAYFNDKYAYAHLY